MSSTRLFEAASISMTSSARPSRIATQAAQRSHGSPSWRFVQLTALATIRASEVLPVPRGPTKRSAWATRPVRTALRSVSTTASWPTISAERLGAPAAVEAPGASRPGVATVGGQSGSTVHAAVRARGSNVPCTLRRSDAPAPTRHERLGPGRSAAPGEDRLVLLPSGPDTVRESPLRGTRSSTSLVAAAFEDGDLGRGFSPAGADCRYRAPLVPRLARHGANR